MKYEEFAFLNQQLAAMLKSGIPLEGALKRLGESMQAGGLREELGRLEADLAKGTPLRDALPRRELPKFYTEMVTLGAAGNDLPGMLTMLADHYRRVGNLWLRLKSLMVYPVIVYLAALAVFTLITWIYVQLTVTAMSELVGTLEGLMLMPPVWVLWVPVFWLAGAGLGFGFLLLLPAARGWLRWRLPGFKEAHLARFASAVQLVLRGGGDLPQALRLTRQLEGDQRLRGELEVWESRLASGHGKPGAFAQPGAIIPPLFVWLVSQSGEDVADGFGRAAAIYAERARYRIEMLLYAALPIMVLVLGLLIMSELLPVARVLLTMLNALGSGE